MNGADVPQSRAPVSAMTVSGMSAVLGPTSNGRVAPAGGGGSPLKQARFSLAPRPEHAPDAGGAVGAFASLPSGPTERGGGEGRGRTAAADGGGGAPVAVAGVPPRSAGAGGTALTGPAAVGSGMPGAAPQQGRGAEVAKGGPAGSIQDLNRRKERNAREKERSCRIAQQIDDLRTLLSRGGVIVSKGTKSSVLNEAAAYINMLQQQQLQWEM